MNPKWAADAIFYHIYPLGLCDAPDHNDLTQPVTQRLDTLYSWLDHLQWLGANAIYLGPVFQSSSHGYDTVDYYQIDRRLGDNDTFARFAGEVHRRGLRLILDAVFNHVGREFWAFKDVLENKENAAYRDWFHNLRFQGQSPKGDPFQYEGWNGHYDLVKLNLSNPSVRSHLFDAVRKWSELFQIDGLRLDAADCLDFDFLTGLRQVADSLSEDFWLMGEVVHGDYRKWVNPERMDSVTNYESYKGLYSSLLDTNYFEIAHTLQRQFGPEGIYRDFWLYDFVDNHDVDRVASKIPDQRLLFPLYLLLFTMPGIPSVYYGSEWGIEGKKDEWSDSALRPALILEELRENAPQPDLAQVIRQLSRLHHQIPALRYGSYQEVYVDHQQFAFLRKGETESVLVVLNSASKLAEIDLPIHYEQGSLRDKLNGNEILHFDNNRVQLKVSPAWGRILEVVQDSV